MFNHKYFCIFFLFQLCSNITASSQITTFTPEQLYGWVNLLKNETYGHYLSNIGNFEELSAWIDQGGNYFAQTAYLDRFPGSTVAHRVTANAKFSPQQKSDLLQQMLTKTPELVHVQKHDGETLGHIAALNADDQTLTLLAQHGDKFEKQTIFGDAVLSHIQQINDLETRRRARQLVFPIVSQYYQEQRLLSETHCVQQHQTAPRKKINNPYNTK